MGYCVLGTGLNGFLDSKVVDTFSMDEKETTLLIWKQLGKIVFTAR